MKYELWEHQKKCFNEAVYLLDSGAKAPLVYIPTRGGKSGVASALIEHYSKDKILFLAHRKILIDQMSDELVSHGDKHSIIAPWAPMLNTRVTVGSKDTLLNRMGRMRAMGWPDYKKILIDEAHLGAASTFQKIIDFYPGAQLVGFTGSPCRLDNKPLGDTFSDLILGPQIWELQAKKILCPIKTLRTDFEYKGPIDDGNIGDLEPEVNRSVVLKDIVKHWKKWAENKKTLTFCVSISHAEAMAKEFTDAGYPSVAISSKDSQEEIDQKLSDFYAGKYINLCSVDLFLMGFTVKDCECIIQARPTESLMIYLQSLGRGMMYLPGKVLINIDAVNNLDRHGYPEDPRNWELGKGNGIPEYKSPYKRCPNCFYTLVPKNAKICPDCGTDVTKKRQSNGGREIEAEEGRLKETYSLPAMVHKHAFNAADAAGIAKVLGFAPETGIQIYERFNE